MVNKSVAIVMEPALAIVALMLEERLELGKNKLDMTDQMGHGHGRPDIETDMDNGHD